MKKKPLVDSNAALCHWLYGCYGLSSNRTHAKLAQDIKNRGGNFSWEFFMEK